MEIDEEMHDRDKEKKEKGKVYSDNKRHAKLSEIKMGDEVWLKLQNKTNKLSPVFEPVAYKVIERKGSELIVENTQTKVR